MEKIIEVSGLKKRYGSIEAVKGIDFYVEPGKLFAFLGPNGAGKSTTIDVICTFLRPDAGRVTVDGRRLGEEDDQIRDLIGVVFQDPMLDALLTVEENLRTRGGFYGLRGRALTQAVEEAARAAGVTEFLKRPYGKLSGGQRRRADIARALVNTPKILFLDEPTTGLDPQTRQRVWETLRRLQRERGVTVFLTTHYMEEADEADFVIVIDDGLVAAKGTPRALKDRYAGDLLKLYARQPEALEALLGELGLSPRRVGGQLHVRLSSTLEALPILARCDGLIDGFEVLGGTMDDAFIAITGKEIRQ